VNDHCVEIVGQKADFVAPMDINRLVKITRAADLMRHLVRWFSGSVMDFAV